MEKLKPCPFCGGKASVKNSGIEKCRNIENGDLITNWYVWCPNCGIKRDGGVSEYYFRNDETLILVNARYDGRQKQLRHGTGGPMMTNADKIRSLNDEELENFLRNIKQRTKIALTVYSQEVFDELCNLTWLQQEVNE